MHGNQAEPVTAKPLRRPWLKDTPKEKGDDCVPELKYPAVYQGLWRVLLNASARKPWYSQDDEWRYQDWGENPYVGRDKMQHTR